ncbi:hypothetical protein [Streptomyces sp. NPDC001927]
MTTHGNGDRPAHGVERAGPNDPNTPARTPEDRLNQAYFCWELIARLTDRFIIVGHDATARSVG